MAKQRDTKAEYQARKARAKAEGFEGYADKRRASLQGFQHDPVAWRITADKARERAEEMRRQIHDLGGNRTLLTTTARGKGFGVISGRLQGSGSGVVHVVLKDGRTRTIYGRGRALDKLRREVRNLADVAALSNWAGNYGDDDISADDIESVQIEIDQ